MSKGIILLIETATTSCSLAVSRGGEVLAIKERDERNIHASHITLFIDEVMKQAGLKYSDLDAVAVSKGPGSYTGLRIGVSAAKGLCYSLDIPLIAVDTLLAMAGGLLSKMEIEDHSLLLPMIDARRMEVYTAAYNAHLSPVKEVAAEIIDSRSLDVFGDKPLLLFGDGAEKFRDMFADKPNVSFVSFVNSAADLSRPATDKLLKGETEDLAYFEPFYLKEFLITAPAKKS